MNTLQQSQIAAQINYFGKKHNLDAPKINTAVRIAISHLEAGHSGATAYEFGAKVVKQLSIKQLVIAY